MASTKKAHQSSRSIARKVVACSYVRGIFFLTLVSLILQLHVGTWVFPNHHYTQNPGGRPSIPTEVKRPSLQGEKSQNPPTDSPNVDPDALHVPFVEQLQEQQPFYSEDECYIPGLGDTNYRYPINSFDSSKNNPPVVVGVLSTALDPQRRFNVRQTWAMGRNRNVFFLVAGNWTTDLANEFQAYNDLFWVEGEEDYREITVKVIAWLAAARKHIPSSLVDKADDDSYIRMSVLEQIARNQQGPLYLGGLVRHGIVFRDKNNPWFVPHELMETDEYPDYAYGGGYVLSPDVNACALEYLEERMDDNLVFPIEDAFVGLMVQRGCKYKVECTNDDRFLTGIDWNGGPTFEKWDIQHKIIVHEVKKEEEMLRLHHAACCPADEDPFVPDFVSCAHITCLT